MPKEHKKRGRREEKKRKRGEDTSDVRPVKKPKHKDLDTEELEIITDVDNAAQYGNNQTLKSPGEMPFYGLLDEEEQEYFRRADELLEVNQFGDAEERNLFLANVYKEASGKELKIANSQSCSRLMERLIIMSTPQQLKVLFGKFSGHFLHLVQHRFASHCCETLFIKSAPIVTHELTTPLEQQQQAPDNREVYVSMENLFLYTLNELEGNLGYLMTDKFASHALRVLLVVLCGQPLAKSSTTSLLASRRKEKIGVAGVENKPDELGLTNRTVPDSFHVAVDKMIADTIVGLDTTYLRALATHPIGNPVLQLLLELELTGSGKQKAKDEKSVFHKLLPDNPPEEGTESASFIQGLVYDSVGSRLLESVVKFAPGKTFKALYRSLFKERLGSLARNEVAGFLVERILERLSKEDLEEAIQTILPQVGSLVERSRTSLIKIMIERCATRNVETSSISEALEKAYGSDTSSRISKMLKLTDGDSLTKTKDAFDSRKDKDPGKVHGSLLAQTMLSVPGPLSRLIADSLLALPMAVLLQVAKDRTASHVLQISLTSVNVSTHYRRNMIQRFFGHMKELATHASGSHVVDCFWTATQGLTFIQERMAEELLANETVIRDSFLGRAVWRNWRMDLYKRKKLDWIVLAKGGNGGEGGGAVNLNNYANETKGSSIQLAREKFAAAKVKKGKGVRVGVVTGANGIGRRINTPSERLKSGS
ncbi:MAG: Nucleolar protein 9 [Pleopsidium flavum]|nr:MAG: Nucleolar protein 9 [Pleopsidium flavum]